MERAMRGLASVGHASPIIARSTHRQPASCARSPAALFHSVLSVVFVMQLQCPYCKFGMSLKEPKAGKFKPACRQCKRNFLLVIDAEGQAKILQMPATQPVKSQPTAD